MQNANRSEIENSLHPDALSEREQRLIAEVLELQSMVNQLQQQNQNLQETETALHEREAQFQVLVENSHDLIYTQAIDGTIEYVAPSVKNVLGYDAAHFLGQPFTNFVHPEDAPRLIQIFGQMRDSGEAQLGIILRMQHEDGKSRWLSSNLTPIVEEDGSIGAYQGLARNITERIQFEQERRHVQEHVRATHAFLKNILNHLPDPIFVQDAQGKFVLGNEALCELLNRPIHKIIGAFESDILPPHLAQQYRRSSREAFETGAAQINELFYDHPDGGTRFLSTKRSVYTDTSQYQFIIGSIRDLTEHRAAEDRLKATQLQLIRNEKMSALGMMIAGIAHEIKNPLNFINGNLFPLEQSINSLFRFIQLYSESVAHPAAELASVLESGEIEFLQEDLPKLVSSMNLGVERMSEIVQSLQNFARHDTDNCQIADLQDGINSTLLILKPRLKACGGRPAIQVVRKYWDLPHVECYPGQLNQVFMNLLSNAIDAIEEAYEQRHTPSGTIVDSDWQPTISITTTQLDDTRIQIRIEDNGSGLSFENQARLFQQAFTTKAIGKGTGMGLTISQQIITERHQGQILCCSMPEQGTIFSLILPKTLTVK